MSNISETVSNVRKTVIFQGDNVKYQGDRDYCQIDDVKFPVFNVTETVAMSRRQC